MNLWAITCLFNPAAFRVRGENYRVFATCALTEAGQVECWGKPRRANVPPGTYEQIAIAPHFACGLDAVGHAHCALDEATLPNRTPADALASLVVGDYRACGLRSDGTIACWNALDDAFDPPAGAFVELAASSHAVCARRADGSVSCFGDADTALSGTYQALASGDKVCGITSDGTAQCSPQADVPPGPLVAISCASDACCGIGADQALHCTGARLGPPPAGAFDHVAVFRGHACALRAGGGVICWGENDAGECNVPQ